MVKHTQTIRRQILIISGETKVNKFFEIRLILKVTFGKDPLIR